jgi:hypothetical protein
MMNENKVFLFEFPERAHLHWSWRDVDWRGYEPDADTAGIFLDLALGDYKVGVQRSDDRLRFDIVRSAPFENAIVEPVTLF